MRVSSITIRTTTKTSDTLQHPLVASTQACPALAQAACPALAQAACPALAQAISRRQTSTAHHMPPMVHHYPISQQARTVATTRLCPLDLTRTVSHGNPQARIITAQLYPLSLTQAVSHRSPQARTITAQLCPLDLTQAVPCPRCSMRCPTLMPHCPVPHCRGLLLRRHLALAQTALHLQALQSLHSLRLPA